MPKSNSRSHKDRSDWGVMELARERPIAAAATAAGAAAAGLFLWSKRNQISEQINTLSDQIGEWTENMTSNNTGSSRTSDSDGRTTRRANMRSGSASRSTSGRRSSGARGRGSTASRSRARRKTDNSSASHTRGTGGEAGGNS